jgi:hypothetical protein
MVGNSQTLNQENQENAVEFQAPEDSMQIMEKTIWPFSDYIHRNSIKP